MSARYGSGIKTDTGELRITTKQHRYLDTNRLKTPLFDAVLTLARCADFSRPIGTFHSRLHPKLLRKYGENRLFGDCLLAPIRILLTCCEVPTPRRLTCVIRMLIQRRSVGPVVDCTSQEIADRAEEFREPGWRPTSVANLLPSHGARTNFNRHWVAAI